MSNFLFRMVSRTAGLGPASGPRPRTEIPQFLSPVPASAPEHQPQPGALPRRNLEVAATPFDVTEDIQSSGYPTTSTQPVSDGSVPPPAPVVPSLERSIDRVAPLPASEATFRISKPPTLAVNPEVAPSLPGEEPAAPQNRERESVISKRPVIVVNHDVHDTIHEVHTIQPAQVVARPVRPAEITPAQPAPVPLENNEVSRAKPDRSSTQPSLAETPAPVPQRPSQPRPAPVVAERQEPPVEVKIGRVEVHMEAPPAAPVPARPQGFAEYNALRRYQARPWDFRNR